MSLLAFTLTRQPTFTEQQSGGAPDIYGDTIATISGLVAWWRFGEAAGVAVAADDQGLQNGHYQAGVSLGHPALMLDTSNTGIRLDGSTGFVEIIDNAAFHLASGTLALWFNTDSLASDRYLVSKDAGGIVQGDLHVYYAAADNTFRFQIEDGAVAQSALPLPIGAIQIDITYCVVVQWGSSGMKLYLASDGALVLSGTNAYTGGLTNNTRAFRIGASQLSGTPSKFFNGAVDDLMLWNRLLSEAEIETVTQASIALGFSSGFSSGFRKT